MTMTEDPKDVDAMDADAGADADGRAESATTREQAVDAALTETPDTTSAAPHEDRWAVDPARNIMERAGSDVPLFSLRDATVSRGGKVILHVDHFDLYEGEHVALLGPNGAGKSTFIQLLTREIAPLWREEPPMRFRGSPRPRLDQIRRTLGVVSSTMHDQVRVHLPAVDIVCGGIYGTLGIPVQVHPTEADWAASRDALARLGIGDVADRDIMTLSTGQSRRVLVARELVRDPQVLVFDEPCTGLDPEGMYHVRETMRMLAAEGRSVVLVTHYPEDIIPDIKRVLLIKEAEIFADGPKEELLTSEVMSDLFDVPLTVEHHGDWYSLYGDYGAGGERD